MITNTYLDSAVAAAAAPDPATFREEIETARSRAALSAREAQAIAYDLQSQAAASEGEPTGLPGAFASREVGVVSLSHVQALVQENAALHYHLRTANATANAAVTDALALFQENAVLRERLAALESFHQRVPPFTPRGMPGGMVFTPRSAVAPAYSHECPPNPLVTAEEAHIRRMYLGRAIRAQDRGTGRLEERTVTPAVTTNPPPPKPSYCCIRTSPHRENFFG